MKCYLKKFSNASSEIKKIVQEITKNYETGGACRYFGTSPICQDSEIIFLFPNFTAIYIDQADNVDEWESMLDKIKYENNSAYLDVFACFY